MSRGVTKHSIVLRTKHIIVLEGTSYPFHTRASQRGMHMRPSAHPEDPRAGAVSQL